MIRLGTGGLALESDSSALTAALALSTATGRPFRWDGFRRREKGLRDVDAEAVSLFARLTDARKEGGEAGDTVIGLEPGKLVAGEHELELPGSRAAMAVLRAVILPVARAEGESTLVVSGSTHAPGGETFEVTSSTWIYLLRQLGLDVSLNLEYAGFAPRGRGKLTARVKGGSEWRSADWSSRKELTALRIVSAGASLPTHVQQRQAARARSGVAITGIEPSVQLLKLRARSSGSTVAITGVFGELPVTTASVSERGKSAEAVGEDAAAAFRRYSGQGAVVPDLLVDTLLLYLGFARGESRLTTPRLRPPVSSTAALVREFTNREVDVDGKPGGPASCKVSGVVPY